MVESSPSIRRPTRRPPPPLLSRRWVINVIGIGSFLLLWELAGRLAWVDPLFISYPTAVAKAGIRLVQTANLWTQAGISLYEFVVGYAIAVVVGVALGVAMGWYSRVESTLDPLVTAMYSSPRSALIPLIMIWFGIGLKMKIVLVFLGAVFPVLVNTIAGVRTADPSVVRAAHSFGASQRDLFFKIILPGAVPQILTGLQLGIGRGILGLVVGEMYAGNKGIGFMIQAAADRFRTADMLFLVILIAVFSIFAVGMFGRLQRRLDRWRSEDPSS